MTQSILTWLVGWPPEFTTAILAMMPVTELQAAIPVARTVFGLSIPASIFYAYIGNAVPAVLILAFLPRIVEFVEQHLPRLRAWTKQRFHGKEDAFRKTYARYGAFALFLYVAIPTPFSGVWSGSILAVLFHIPLRYAVPAIFFGMLSTAVIVTLAVEGVLGFSTWLT